MPAFRAAIRVQPGARRDSVGGAAAGGRPASGPHAADPPVLLVRVRARPVEGAATAAAERAVADALGLRPRLVRVVRGATSRDKLIEVSDPPPDIAERWAALLGANE